MGIARYLLVWTFGTDKLPVWFLFVSGRCIFPLFLDRALLEILQTSRRRCHCISLPIDVATQTYMFLHEERSIVSSLCTN